MSHARFVLKANARNVPATSSSITPENVTSVKFKKVAWHAQKKEDASSAKKGIGSSKEKGKAVKRLDHIVGAARTRSSIALNAYSVTLVQDVPKTISSSMATENAGVMAVPTSKSIIGQICASALVAIISP